MSSLEPRAELTRYILIPATTTAAYYILNDNIYQGPSLYTVINERVVRLLSLSLPSKRRLNSI